MANSDAAHLEALKTARDAIVAALAEGAVVVRYKVNNREVEREASSSVLAELEKAISIYERKVSRAATSPMRVASLGRTSTRGL